MSICKGVSLYTGKPCKHIVVNKFTVNKKTGEFLDPNFCQMHQPGKESSKKCVCKYCAYHRSREIYAQKSTSQVVKKVPQKINDSHNKTQLQNYCESLLKK